MSTSRRTNLRVVKPSACFFIAGESFVNDFNPCVIGKRSARGHVSGVWHSMPTPRDPRRRQVVVCPISLAFDRGAGRAHDYRLRNVSNVVRVDYVVVKHPRVADA